MNRFTTERIKRRLRKSEENRRREASGETVPVMPLHPVAEVFYGSDSDSGSSDSGTDSGCSAGGGE